MEIKRVGENKVRCALTEAEIQKLGFDLDEIIGDSERTRQFVRVVLGIIEKHMEVADVSTMVQAELLQNHSMAITFGMKTDFPYQESGQTHIYEIEQQEAGQKEPKTGASEKLRKNAQTSDTQGQGEKQEAKRRMSEVMVCAMRFERLEDMCRMSRVCFPGKVPASRLYKLQGSYYLLLNFAGFTKDEMRPFVFGTVEYDNGHYSDAAQLAFIREHGICMMKRNAVEMLMQL